MDPRSEAGDSLIELIIAVAILGLAVTAILGAIASGLSLSVVHRRQTDASAVLISASEAIKDSSINPHVACASTYDITTGITYPTGWSASNVEITSIEFWDGTFVSGALNWRSRTACVGGAGTTDDEFSGASKVQKITLLATSPDGDTSLSIDVIKGGS
jgi:type II secretory pathway pseudopilin PulG